MTTTDVPAEREELLPCPFCGEEPHLHEPAFVGDDWQVGCQCGDDEDERNPGAIWRNGKTFEEVAARWNRRATPQEAPTEGISLSAQLSQAAAWMRVWDECQRLGMDTYGAPSTSTGLDIVLDFIRGRAAPQEAREPEVLTVEKPMTLTYPCGCVATYRLSETVRFCGANEHSPNALRGDAFVLLGAPATERDAEAAVREALDAINKAHAAVDDLCNGRRWTMSIPARPDADHDLVIDDALTKAERVIRSLIDVPAGE